MSDFDKYLNELPAISSPADGDLLYIEEAGGRSVKINWTALQSALEVDWSQILNRPSTFPPDAHDLNFHSNVNDPGGIGPSDPLVLTKYGPGGIWAPEPPILLDHALNFHTDVSSDPPSAGMALVYQTMPFSGWVPNFVDWNTLLNVPSTFPPDAHALGSHSDVVISGPVHGDIIAFDTSDSRWKNVEISEPTFGLGYANPDSNYAGSTEINPALTVINNQHVDSITAGRLRINYGKSPIPSNFKVKLTYTVIVDEQSNERNWTFSPGVNGVPVSRSYNFHIKDTVQSYTFSYIVILQNLSEVSLFKSGDTIFVSSIDITIDAENVDPGSEVGSS